MPDDTPAEVNTSPSRTKIASGSTPTSGNARAMRAVWRQCVVARLPSSSPACARTNEPVHTDASRRVRSRSACTSAGSIGWEISSSLPATTTASAASIDETSPVT